MLRSPNATVTASNAPSRERQPHRVRRRPAAPPARAACALLQHRQAEIRADRSVAAGHARASVAASTPLPVARSSSRPGCQPRTIRAARRRQK